MNEYHHFNSKGEEERDFWLTSRRMGDPQTYRFGESLQSTEVSLLSPATDADTLLYLSHRKIHNCDSKTLNQIHIEGYLLVYNLTLCLSLEELLYVAECKLFWCNSRRIGWKKHCMYLHSLKHFYKIRTSAKALVIKGHYNITLMEFLIICNQSP